MESTEIEEESRNTIPTYKININPGEVYVAESAILLEYFFVLIVWQRLLRSTACQKLDGKRFLGAREILKAH